MLTSTSLAREESFPNIISILFSNKKNIVSIHPAALIYYAISNVVVKVISLYKSIIYLLRIRKKRSIYHGREQIKFTSTNLFANTFVPLSTSWKRD
jgi:hypothetical protein